MAARAPHLVAQVGRHAHEQAPHERRHHHVRHLHIALPLPVVVAPEARRSPCSINIAHNDNTSTKKPERSTAQKCSMHSFNEQSLMIVRNVWKGSLFWSAHTTGHSMQVTNRQAHEPSLSQIYITWNLHADLCPANSPYALDHHCSAPMPTAAGDHWPTTELMSCTTALSHAGHRRRGRGGPALEVHEPVGDALAQKAAHHAG